MAERSKTAKAAGWRLTGIIVVSVAAVVGAVLVVATLYRSGSFSVVAQGQGNSIEFKFSESRVDLNELLDQMLSKSSKSDGEATSRRRIVSSVLQAHGYYYIPSEELIAHLRLMKETDDTRKFVQAIRAMLYDLAGPFSRPATFMDAPDDRVLLAIDDVYEKNPANPVIAKLWEMSLDQKGIFSARDIKTLVRVDRGLKAGTAATCAGSLLLDRSATLASNQDMLIEVRISVPRSCEPVSAEKMLAGKEPTVWLSAADLSNLVGTATPPADGRYQAMLVPIPKMLSAAVPGQ